MPLKKRPKCVAKEYTIHSKVYVILTVHRR